MSEIEPTTGRESILLAIASSLNATLEIQEALERVLELTASAIGADAASVFVHRADDRQEELRVSFVRRGGTLEQCTLEASLGAGLSGHVLRTGEPVMVEDVREDPRFQGKLDAAFGARTRALLAVPLRRRGQVIGLLEVLRERRAPFGVEALEFLTAVANEVAVAVDNARLVEELRQELRERELLMEVSRKVGSSLNLDEVLDHLFDVLAEVVPYDAGGVYLLDGERGTLNVVQHRGYPEGTDEVLRSKPGKGITGWVARERRGQVVERVDEDPRYLEARPSTCSEMAAPIVAGGRVIGVINLESDQAGAFSQRDLHLLEPIAAQVATAIANARAHASELERSRLGHELELARDIQCRLLPDRSLQDPRLEAAGINISSSAVGGDYYDYLSLEEERTALALADVSGSGLSAALLMAAVRTGVRLELRSETDPAAVARRLNQLLEESIPENQFVAAVLALLDPTGTLRYCNAGHHPPLLLGSGPRRRLEGGGLILGAFPDSSYETRTVQLAPGDLLVFYTDGLTELADAQGEQFGPDRLEGTLQEVRDRPLPEMIEVVRAAARRHRGSEKADDDVTLMLVRWLGGPG